MRPCVLARVTPLAPSLRLRQRDVDEPWRTAREAASGPRAEPELQTQLRSERSDDIAARQWLIRRLAWEDHLAALHARAGSRTHV